MANIGTVPVKNDILLEGMISTSIHIKYDNTSVIPSIANIIGHAGRIRHCLRELYPVTDYQFFKICNSILKYTTHEDEENYDDKPDDEFLTIQVKKKRL